MVYIDKESLTKLLNDKGSFLSCKNAAAKHVSTKNVPSNTVSTKNVSPNKPTDSTSGPFDEPDSYREAFRKIERLVKVRDRSMYEVKQRLIKDNYQPDAIEYAIQRARACSYLDDERFADGLVRSRLRSGKGLAGIIRELKSHHIDPESLLQDFPDAYLEDVPDQTKSALLLLCKKPPRAKNKLQAAYAKLLRNGYSSGLASDVARQWYERYCDTPRFQ
ncbi:MAG: regulatory protein RecX [Eggerthellaceae bacterium]